MSDAPDRGDPPLPMYYDPRCWKCGRLEAEHAVDDSCAFGPVGHQVAHPGIDVQY